MYKKILSFGAVIAILDQIIKNIIVSNVAFSDSIKVIKNFFYITNINNTGAAFGILQDGGIIFIILSIIALVGLIRYVIIDKNIVKLEAISYALVLGGILGNFIDRIMYGYIIDYLDFYFFGYNFPVFNLADMCMVIGFMIIIFNMFISKGETNEINISRRKK
ncbi:MAG: signal peptidase II [Bacilli bacterium]|nr:signal peptidase II [Bacilli bacterium]